MEGSFHASFCRKISRQTAFYGERREEFCTDSFPARFYTDNIHFLTIGFDKNPAFHDSTKKIV